MRTAPARQKASMEASLPTGEPSSVQSSAERCTGIDARQGGHSTPGGRITSHFCLDEPPALQGSKNALYTHRTRRSHVQATASINNNIPPHRPRKTNGGTTSTTGQPSGGKQKHTERYGKTALFAGLQTRQPAQGTPFFFFLREEMHLRIQLPRRSWYVGLRGARRDYPLKPHGGINMNIYEKAVWRNKSRSLLSRCRGLLPLSRGLRSTLRCTDLVASAGERRVVHKRAAARSPPFCLRQASFFLLREEMRGRTKNGCFRYRARYRGT
jgi:hypothetical protein